MEEFRYFIYKFDFSFLIEEKTLSLKKINNYIKKEKSNENYF